MRSSVRSTSPRAADRSWLISIGLGVLTFAVFSRAIYFPFITYDDRLYVLDNPHVLDGLRWSNLVWAFTTWQTGNWHPLTWISLMLDAQIFGKNAGGYHFINVLLHVANSVFLFLILRQLTDSQWRSAFVAALFAFHPLHVESVAWVSERKDVLSAFFFLLAVGGYAYYVARPDRKRYGLLVLFFLLGLLSKSMVLTLPFVLLLLDVWPLRRNLLLSRLLWEKLPLFVISAGFAVVTFLAQRSAGTTMPMSVEPLSMRVQNAVVSYVRYLAKIFWPHDLALPYPFSRSINAFELIAAAALLIIITLIAIKTARRHGYLFTGWFWFSGMLVPVIGLVQVGPQAMADRYTYLPSIGIFIALTWCLADLTSTIRSPRSVHGVLATVVLSSLTWLTSIQLGYWRNSETLFRHSLALHPNEIVALRNLATEYISQHRTREAIACLESQLSRTPNDAVAHFHLGQELNEIGEIRRAVEEYETALRFAGEEDKHNVTGSALNNLAWIRATSADPTLRDGAEAVRLAERSCALTSTPDAGQLDTLAAAYAANGDFDRGIQTATRALQLAESAHNEALRREIAKHVDLFRQGKGVTNR